MARALLLLALALALLSGTDWALARLERARRGQDPRIERLVSKDRQAGASVAALSIEAAGGELLYARKKGLWRSREAFGAVCDGRGIEALLASLLEGRGVVRSQDPGAAREYGFEARDAFAVRLHGPKLLEAEDRDVRFAFEVGRSFAEGPSGRAFVRERGSTRILEIDRDPRAALGSTDGPLPPLLDTHLLAGSASERFRGFVEMRVEPAEGGGFVVARSESGWVLDSGGKRGPCLAWRAGGYMSLLLRGRFDEVASPARVRELGLDPPRARIVLVPDEGERLEIEVSAPDPAGRAWTWNRATNVVASVRAELLPLLVPSPDAFQDEQRANPWEDWLRGR